MLCIPTPGQSSPGDAGGRGLVRRRGDHHGGCGDAACQSPSRTNQCGVWAESGRGQHAMAQLDAPNGYLSLPSGRFKQLTA